MIQIKQDSSISAIFIESNSSYPQLSTKFQLATSLIGAILVGIFMFLRKSIPLDVTMKEIKPKKNEKEIKDDEYK